ncbi:hypothetical protein SM033_00064 [Vibrio phage vB_VpaM_sm033]|nr:hypothetical protein SM033_00064 [Vibrio phage vB_VpaM_sm033]
MSTTAIVAISVAVFLSVAVICFTYLEVQRRKEYKKEIDELVEENEAKVEVAQEPHSDEFTKAIEVLQQLDQFVDYEMNAVGRVDDMAELAEEINKRFRMDLKHHNMCFTYLSRDERITLTWIIVASYFEKHHEVLLTFKFKGAFEQAKLERLPVPVRNAFLDAGKYYSERDGVITYGRIATS